MAIIQGRERGTNVEANNTSGGGAVRHKKKLGILIFLVITMLHMFQLKRAFSQMEQLRGLL